MKLQVLLDGKNNSSGLDDYTCKTEYDAKGKNKSYNFWNPLRTQSNKD
jgi:hypothetical protein